MYGVFYLFIIFLFVCVRVDIVCDIDIVKLFVLVGVNFIWILFLEICKGVDLCIYFYVWWDEIKFYSFWGLNFVEDFIKYFKRYN